MPLAVNPPFNGRDLLTLFGLMTVPSVAEVVGSTFRRSVRLRTGPAVLAVDMGGDAPSASAVLSSPSDAAQAAALAGHLVDATVDPMAVDARLAADPALSESVRAMPGVRLPGAVDPHELLIGTIVGQQVSVAAARVAQAKLVRRAGTALPAWMAVGGVTHLFPAAGDLARLSLADIEGPRRRAQAVLDAASDLASGALVLHRDRDRGELVAELVARPGIGPWTASYVVMHALGAADELLTVDLVMRTGARLLGIPATPRGLAEYGRRWAPYRTYAGFHLWRAALLSTKTGWSTPAAPPAPPAPPAPAALAAFP